MIAPKNKPRKPLNKKPPMAPKKITAVGTEAPFPKNIGFKILSNNMTMIRYTDQMDAGTTSLVREFQRFYLKLVITLGTTIGILPENLF